MKAHSGIWTHDPSVWVVEDSSCLKTVWPLWSARSGYSIVKLETNWALKPKSKAYISDVKYAGRRFKTVITKSHCPIMAGNRKKKNIKGGKTKGTYATFLHSSTLRWLTGPIRRQKRQDNRAYVYLSKNSNWQTRLRILLPIVLGEYHRNQIGMLWK
jgi:hypothetical protein